MSKKIKVNIPGFGERYCSSNVEYKLFCHGNVYIFFKKGTGIRHNEYGPAAEYKHGSYEYWINNKYHRLSGYTYYGKTIKVYDVIGECLGEKKEDFITNLSNVLIPKS